MSERYVLDASALLSILLNEPGQDQVDRLLDSSRIHAVNLAEVIGRLVRSGVPLKGAVAALAELHLDVEKEFGVAQAEFCGELLAWRRDLGLSLGDCVCLTTAARSSSIAVTADRCWRELDGSVL